MFVLIIVGEGSIDFNKNFKGIINRKGFFIIHF